MFPRVIDIPLGFTAIPIHSFGLMVLAGFLAGLWVAGRRARARGLPPELMTDLSVWLLLGGLLGARIAYILFYNRQSPKTLQWEYDFQVFNLADGNLHVLGAVGGFLLASVWWWRKTRRRPVAGTPTDARASAGKGPGADPSSSAPPGPPFPAADRKLGPGAIARGIAFICLIALLAGRVLYVALNRDEYNLKLFAIWEGGIVFYGGFLGGLAAGLIYLWRRRVPPLVVMDIVGPSLALGMVFGRIGCFLKGCCFGAVCRHPWAVRFPGIVGTAVQDGRVVEQADGSPAFIYQWDHQLIPSDATHSLPIHPTQLYESMAMLALFFLLSWYGSRRPRPGRVFAALGTGYGLWRFAVEFLRGDIAGLQRTLDPALGLNASQVLSLGIAAVSALAWVLLPRGPAGAAPAAGGAEGAAASGGAP